MGWPPEPPEYDEPDGVDMSEPAEKTPSGINIEVQDYALRNIREAAAARIAEHLSADVEKMIQARLDALMDEAWCASIRDKAMEAINAYLIKPRQKTNHYGEPTGSAESIADTIPGIVESWLSARVNRTGEVVIGYDRKDYPTRVEHMIQTLVTGELKKETEKAAKDVTEKARAVVASHVGRFISEQMVPAIEVQKS
jgi:hypothetical protein